MVKVVERAEGKWSQSLGNSFFTDSNWLLPDLVEVVEDALAQRLLVKNKDSSAHLKTFRELSELALDILKNLDLNQYAFIVLGKLKDRTATYLYGDFNQLVHENNRFLFNFIKELYYFKAPMWISVEKYEFVNFQLDSILFTIIFFLFLIDGILIYSLMLQDVEERTYEFAMLRCLGFKNQNLVTLLLVQVAF